MRILMLPLTFVLLIFTSPLSAQEAGDVDAIRVTINNYIEGIREGDKSKLAKAFLDSKVHMKAALINNGTQEVHSMDLEQTLTMLSSNPRDEVKGHILSINIYNPTAAFVVFDFNNTFIDGIQLLKVKGDWRIINKTFTDK